MAAAPRARSRSRAPAGAVVGPVVALVAAALVVAGLVAGAPRPLADERSASEGRPALQGSYVQDGGRYEMGRCPGPSTRADGTAVAADGATWQRRERGCTSTGAGTDVVRGRFVLVAPDGSTLEGTFVRAAGLARDGALHRDPITHGTGRLAGASGECELTVHVTPLDDAAVRQAGDLTCRVAFHP